MSNLLAYLAAFLISPMSPPVSGDWAVNHSWQIKDGKFAYSASSQQLLSDCITSPSSYIELPLIVQGVQTISIDGRTVFQTGDQSFKTASQSFNTGTVPCIEIYQGEKITWDVQTVTFSLAKLTAFPKISEDIPLSQVFFNTLNDAAAVAIPVLGLICAAMFYGKLEFRIVSSFLVSALLYGGFFALSDPQSFQINGKPFYVFRLADSVLWFATIFQMQFFSLLGFIGKRTLYIHNALVVVGLICIGFSADLDQSQVGSTISMGSNLFILSCILLNSLVHIYRKKFSRSILLQVASLACFVFAGTNDILLSNGFMASYQVFHLGVLGCMCFMALATNELILATYRERDYLRAHLQDEVDRKTIDLQQKSDELAKTLKDLQVAQADLVQSAKLASLGTLSAGIAHEINNSLNYVKGSIQPLEILLNKDEVNETDKSKIKRLLGLMKEGLNLTLDIISNLKRHMGSTQAGSEMVDLCESVRGTLLLLTSKVKNEVHVDIDIPEGLVVAVKRVSLSQVVMNLVSNAVDAMETKNRDKRIEIKAGEDEAHVWLNISDNGNGISEEILNQIFDPFFTTKEIGKGTGLGLHIVRQEVQKTGGTIQVESKIGVGTTFKLCFPKYCVGREAA